uniref:Uncharacterized protein n=1 Tax=Eutreptiella gymnastica TaxID=73025 RepID=A0A7S1IPC4_9EUGL
MTHTPQVLKGILNMETAPQRVAFNETESKSKSIRQKWARETGQRNSPPSYRGQGLMDRFSDVLVCWRESKRMEGKGHTCQGTGTEEREVRMTEAKCVGMVCG